MNQKYIKEFKKACTDFLDAYSLTELRIYGRKVGVENPTVSQKEYLMEEIVAVLAGEKAPVVASKRGAPVKSESYDPKIDRRISELRYIYAMNLSASDFAFLATSQKKSMFAASSDIYAPKGSPHALAGDTFTGQLETVEGVSCLITLDGDYTREKVVVTLETIENYRLRDGDVVTCRYKEFYSVCIVTEVLYINAIPWGMETRYSFDAVPVVSPHTLISFAKSDGENKTETKFVDWLAPIGFGQRCLIYAPPKAGKTKFALQLAAGLAEQKTDCERLALLIGQTPETVFQYKQTFGEHAVVARSYEDAPEEQVAAIEFLLKRAKRFMEMSKNVVLFVDSFTEIAKAYEDFGLSEGGKRLPSGIGAETLRCLKQIFGLARATQRFGSLTVIGTVSTRTGNPIDDDIFAGLRPLANCEIALSDEMAKRRIFPAIDLVNSFSCDGAYLFSDEKAACEYLVRNQLLESRADEVYGALETAWNFHTFYGKMLALKDLH